MQKIHSPPLDDETRSLVSEIHLRLTLLPSLLSPKDFESVLLKIAQQSRHDYALCCRPKLSKKRSSCAGVRCCDTKATNCSCDDSHLLGFCTLAQNVAQCLHFSKYTRSQFTRRRIMYMKRLSTACTAKSPRCAAGGGLETEKVQIN